MYAMYGKIYHQYTPDVSIYTSTMDPMGSSIPHHRHRKIFFQRTQANAGRSFFCRWCLLKLLEGSFLEQKQPEICPSIVFFKSLDAIFIHFPGGKMVLHMCFFLGTWHSFMVCFGTVAWYSWAEVAGSPGSPPGHASQEAIYQSVAHASTAGAIIRVGEQVHPFKPLGLMRLVIGLVIGLQLISQGESVSLTRTTDRDLRDLCFELHAQRIRRCNWWGFCCRNTQGLRLQM